MIETLNRILNDPFPLEEDRRAQVLVSLAISMIAVILIAILKPFGLESLPYQMAKQIPIYMGYGFVTFVMCLMVDFIIKPAFPVFFDEQFWTVKKNIVWVVFVITLISIGNLFYSNALGFTGISGRLLLSHVVYVGSVSVIPVILLTLLIRYVQLNKNLKLVDEINRGLSIPLIKRGTQYPIIFSSEQNKESLEVSPEEFLFAESADNFTDLVYIENGIIKRYLIEASLKSIEEFNSSEYVTRVHRAYMANLYKVERVIGNAQGYRLVFGSVDQTVPVSKRTSEVVKRLLLKMHGS